MRDVSRPDGRNEHRPVLILGAGSDMAMALARLLAARGHPLDLCARDPAGLERDRADLTVRHGVEVRLHRHDVLDPDGGAQALLAALPAPPRIVICAVGLLGDQAADAADPDRSRRIIDTNFTGPAIALERIASAMADAGESCAVIGIGSVAGDRGRAKNYVYGAAKAGFAAWMSGMRQKYAAGPVHVLTVKPGFVATSMTEGMDLPAPLTLSAEAMASGILRALDRGAQVHCPWKWRIIMGIICARPEAVFMRTKF
jgi:decaprenylphospho-beta-D-erythro-pentofuranosid-2-ulose 2-reductase